MLTIPVLTTKCTTCRGRGVLVSWDGSVKKCPRCGGSGLMNLRVRRLKFDYCFPTFQISSSGGAQTQELQLDDDAYFEQVGWSIDQMAISVGLGAGTASAVQITDLSTGWQFSNNPLSVQNFASVHQITSAGGLGSGAFGSGAMFPLLVPYIWKPSSQIQAVLTWPNTTSGNLLVQIVLKGYKVYPLDSQRLPEETIAA